MAREGAGGWRAEQEILWFQSVPRTGCSGTEPRGETMGCCVLVEMSLTLPSHAHPWERQVTVISADSTEGVFSSLCAFTGLCCHIPRDGGGNPGPGAQHPSLDIYFMWLHCFLLPPELLGSRVLPLGFKLWRCVNLLEKLVFWGFQ